jgi:NAD-dependent dihydropyrimidine dehydrogenase PreA subunit
MPEAAPRILCCTCSREHTLDETALRDALEELARNGSAVDTVDDLCGLVGKKPDELAASLAGGGVTVVACAARTVRCLLEQAGIEQETIPVVGLRDGSGNGATGAATCSSEAGDSPPRPMGNDVPLVVLLPADHGGSLTAERRAELQVAAGELGLPTRTPGCLCELGSLAEQGPTIVLTGGEVLSAGPAPETFRLVAADGPPEEVARRLAETARQLGWAGRSEWTPWFPVIDRTLCTNCRQCLGFCLFGTFDGTGERVEVARPAACKTNCPACARVCPSGAIVFPKYASGPVNGDQTDQPADEPVQVDLKQLMQGDLLEQLRRRDAGQPPCSCITQLTEKLGIPAEVVENLSAQQQQSLAEQAPTDPTDRTDS